MITREGDRLVLSGRLIMSTVPAVYADGMKYLVADDLMVDFSQVEAVDSAAVSMLLCWIRAAQAQNRSLRVKGLSGDFLSLANLYGVAEMLPKQ
ncbi:MAG: STAS domain-containing protein [Gallionella sp.]|nr:STAS domain-containing protein [Gallionella sp.]MDD5612625.1 STAS domain-containing protein [Gallionella sp.]